MYFIADAQVRNECRAFAGEHAAGQWHRRQEIPAQRMAVGTDGMSGDVTGTHTSRDNPKTSKGGSGDTAQITFYMNHESLVTQ